MNVLHILSKSRGPRNLASRIFTVMCRFGFSSKRFERRLKRYFEITQKVDCLPTFAITAVILARHPRYIKELSEKGVEFAVHGYTHIDYKVLAAEEKMKHFKKAMEIFNKYKIPFIGFRAPFLRVNESTSSILSNLGFTYHSSRVFHWPIIDTGDFSRYTRNNYKRLIEFCLPLDSEKYLALPKYENGLVEIPVSLPDDETIIERLGISDQNTISEIWLEMLQKIYDSGELFILSLHPERIYDCETALLNTLQKAKAFKPSVWIATLKEIAEWWKEREGFSFKLTPLDEGKYRVEAKCSPRATVLIKNVGVNAPASHWSDGYQTVEERDFVLESPKRPVIGVSRDAPESAVKFIESEGYIVEKSDSPGNHGLYFKNLSDFQEADEKPLAAKIEQSGAPLLRFWRWPDKARSAFSVTGDIDSMTVTDFILRIIENGLVKRG